MGRPAWPPMGWLDQIGLFATGYVPFLVADIVLEDMYVAAGIGFACLGCAFVVCAMRGEELPRLLDGQRAGKEDRAPSPSAP